MRGGKRKGAGRKPLPPDIKKQPITIRLKPALLAWMKSQDGSYSAQINNALLIKKKIDEETED
jgi:uncharacterized protein (DUF4415 family)